MHEVLALARCVEAHDRAELDPVGTHRDLVRLPVLEPAIEYSSRPLSPSDSLLSPDRYCSGSTPIISRFERWIRS